jgi:PPOX class probable F420-dependent enzyme
VEIGEALEFIKANHHGVIATTRADGRTAMSPIACDVDPEGRVVVSTRETAMKVKHIAREPHVAICVLNDRFFGEWAQVEGTAEIVHLPEAMEGLIDYYRRVSGEHPDWDDYRAAMERDRRVLLRISVERVGPNRSG